MPDNEIFSETTLKAKCTDCGINDQLFCSVLIADLQEAAENAADECGWGTDFINQHNLCWIVLRSKLKINRLPMWKENFTIKTWHTGVDKISFGREYEVIDSNGQIIAASTSMWILCEVDTHRPVIPKRISNFPSTLPQSERLAIGESSPRLKFPNRSEIEEKGISSIISKHADYSELDHNHHVNNSRYIAWAYDSIYKYGIDTNKVSSLSINYINEVKSNEKVDIYLIKDSNLISIYGYKNDDEKVFVVEMELN